MDVIQVAQDVPTDLPVTCAVGSRGSARQEAILQACLELVTELGYDRLTMDAVAERARASKATIYRRWPGKPELIAAALRLYGNADAIKVGDAANLREDLFAVLSALREKFACHERALLGGLIHAMQRDPELAGIMRQQILRNKQAIGEIIADRAAGRGEPEPDVELIRDLIGGQLMARLLITGEPVDDDYLHRLVDRILMPLLT